MKHLEKWEESRGNRWQGEVITRNEYRMEMSVFKCSVCDLICKSKGGLVNHRRRMHEELKEKKVFKCPGCLEEFKKQASLSNHEKVCGGAGAAPLGRVRCACGKDYSKSYFARHLKQCPAWLTAPAPTTPLAPVAPGRVARARRAARPAVLSNCSKCGKRMRRDNVARHQKEACPGSETGP